MDGMLPRLEELLKSKNIFVRNRKKIKTRSLGILLYHYGLSLRKCKTILSSFEEISHEAIRKWYHRVYTIFTVKKIYREIIAVDETKVKINGKLYILWAAIDIQTREILGIWVTKGRASIEAYSFLRYVLNKCVNRPKILVDGGPWYKPALQRLHIEWEHITFGLRNPIEQ
jgi:transposase-like protein